MPTAAPTPATFLPYQSLGSYDLYHLHSSHRFHTLLTLPSSQKAKRQKLLCGDDTGHITCLTLRKQSDVDLLYKLQHSKKEVTTMTLMDLAPLTASGSSKQSEQLLAKYVDRIYVTYGSQIQCLNRHKGTVVTTFPNTLNEEIHALAVGLYDSTSVQNDTLWLVACTEYAVNVFDVLSDSKLQDQSYYLSSEAITCMLPLYNAQYVLIGCKNQTLRVVQGNNCVQTICMSATVSVLHVVSSTSSSVDVVYGTVNGCVGMMRLKKSTDSKSVFTEEMLWQTSTSASANDLTQLNGQSTATVTCITTKPQTSQSLLIDIIVGKEDGNVLIYTYNPQQASQLPPITFYMTFSECITSITTGHIISTAVQEVVVSTYSGRIVVLTSETQQSSGGTKIVPVQATNRAAPTSTSEQQIVDFGYDAQKIQQAALDDGSSASLQAQKELTAEMDYRDQMLNGGGSAQNAAERSTAVTTLRTEITELQQRLATMKEKYTKSMSHELIAATTDIASYKLLSSLKLVETDTAGSSLFTSLHSTYCLTVELPVTIDYVLIQCNITLMVVTDSLDDKNNSTNDFQGLIQRSHVDVNTRPVIQREGSMTDGRGSGTAGNGGNSSTSQNDTLLTVKFPSHVTTSKCTLHFRPIEGQMGTLNVYVIPRSTPKVVVKQDYQLRSLCLHTKLNEAPTLPPTAAFTTLRINGNFTVLEFHTWLNSILNDLPTSRLMEQQQQTQPNNDMKYNLTYKSVFVGSLLTIEYSNKYALLQSTSPSTIAILKDHLSREATSRNLTMNMNVDITQQSIQYVLDLLHTKLDSAFTLQRSVALLPALREIEQHNQPAGDQTLIDASVKDLSIATNFLTDEYKQILQQGDQLQSQYKLAPKFLDFLQGVITDLYVDVHKLQGKTVKPEKVATLLQVLGQSPTPQQQQQAATTQAAPSKLTDPSLSGVGVKDHYSFEKLQGVFRDI